MKNTTPENQNMPSMYISRESAEEKYNFQQPLLQGNQGQVEMTIHSQIPGLICCDSDLSNSFEIAKNKAGKLSGINHLSTGHYIQKILSNVSLNSRSQSLPCCLETKKQYQLIPDDNIIEKKHNVHAQSMVNREQIGETVTVESNNKIPSESWFRTWPERGCYEKVTSNTQNNNVNNNTGDYQSVESEDNSNCSKPSDNDPATMCVGSQRSKPESSFDFKPSKTICDNAMNFQSRSTNHSETKSSIPLMELLQSMPIAYSPLTRQLHLIRPGDAGDPAKTLDSIEEEERCYRRAEDDSLSYESPRSTLARVGTHNTSLSRTDASSFSSIVSSLSDTSPSTNGDTATGSLLDRDDVSVTHSLGSMDSASIFEERGAKPKKKGLSSFFTRNVFTWKSQPNSGSAGWKLFSKATSPAADEAEDEDLPDTQGVVDGVASSSALILHPRPSNLPAKPPTEDLRHRLEYQGIMEAARKRELKEARQRKKQLSQQLKQEEQLANAVRIWTGEILPKWDLMKSSRKARELWWSGLPPSVRGKVWRLAIGNDLNITHQLYDICVSRARERLRAGESRDAVMPAGDNPDKESSVELIQLDIARTFPHLCIFQQGGPYYDMLHCLLGAYCCYRPDVGYMQGMSFIAAVLILNLEAADAFICFANLLNRPCLMTFFRLDQPLMQAYCAAYSELLRENLPRLSAHFSESALTCDLYLLDWVYTVFAKAMPLDVACRVWDVFLRDGEEFLFKAALGVLHLHQETLLKLDFIRGAQFLTRLPDDLSADLLFRSIESIRTTVGKQRFPEVLSRHMEHT